MQIAGAVALVTGASSGIGREVALALGRRGAAVALIGRDETRLGEVAAQCRAAGAAAALPLRADVADWEAVNTVVGELERTLGPADILVNSAGVMYTGPVHRMAPEHFAEMVRTNYLGTVYPTRAVLPGMIARRRGSIVNLSSLAGRVAARGYGGYAPTKYAVAGFTDALRQEVAHRGIHVCGVYPGPVDTPMVRDREGKGPADPFPLVPLLRPERVAEAVVRAIERRRRHVYLPAGAGLVGLLYTLWPQPVEWIYARFPIGQNRVD
ncbi:SDR family NAD(P)-dependent oxidoreductase [Caldinitratiruptor microaerophilus]|uniref:Ketoreductase domain-containing protein n=1 Tax=Caldinitratiruptor microaerophilus TaxID=671077 RepID=A0AA35CKS6_9FIRM|nr:SDR family NAD(P)-dependent oxidoreductase [Caldinitratiruptor microaerophilus]BDG61022.1 hypothetical protein caldi_21120 [Caldinitratiruptor microaerophilus]